MISLSGIRDWISGFDIGENFYIGKLDNNKEKSVGIYQRENYGSAEISIGGQSTTKTKVKQVSVLVHWNKNARETEMESQKLYDSIINAGSVIVDGHEVDYVRMLLPEPVEVGTDDRGVYERVIWFDMYYKSEKG